MQPTPLSASVNDRFDFRRVRCAGSLDARPAVRGSAVAALGTDKLSSFVGTSAAAVTYNRNSVSDLPTAMPTAASAFVGSAVGAVLASRVPADAFRLVVFVLLVCVWLYTRSCSRHLVRPNNCVGKVRTWRP